MVGSILHQLDECEAIDSGLDEDMLDDLKLDDTEQPDEDKEAKKWVGGDELEDPNEEEDEALRLCSNCSRALPMVRSIFFKHRNFRILAHFLEQVVVNT